MVLPFGKYILKFVIDPLYCNFNFISKQAIKMIGSKCPMYLLISDPWQWDCCWPTSTTLHCFIDEVLTQCKIPKFHLITWGVNFVKRHSFSRVLRNFPETMRKLCVSTKFPHQYYGNLCSGRRVVVYCIVLHIFCLWGSKSTNFWVKDSEFLRLV